MQRIFLILLIGFLTVNNLQAQPADTLELTIRDKMTEFISTRLQLTKEEVKYFRPLFNKYYRDWRRTIQQYRNDDLLMQQKILELKIQYRPMFIESLGKFRAQQVYENQKLFLQHLNKLQKERKRKQREV